MKLKTPKTVADKKLVEDFYNNHSNLELRVWHKPQIPCKSFETPVRNLAEAALLLDTLARYDAFQLEENIKPDYSNVNGVVFKNNKTGEWEDYYYESEEHYFDMNELTEYLEENGFISGADWKLENVT
jgi:hypothetical protein